MAKLMMYDSEEHIWKQAKLSEVYRYKDAKVFIKGEWIAIKDMVEDDMNGN